MVGVVAVGRVRVPTPLVPALSNEEQRAGCAVARGFTFQRIMEEFLRWKATQVRQDHTMANYRRTVELARGLPEDPSVGDLLRWRAAIFTSYPSPRTAQLQWDNLSAVFSYGHAAGFLRVHVWKLCPKQKRPPTRQRGIHDIRRHWPRVLAAAVDVRERAFLAVLRFAGLRIAEARALRLDTLATPARGPWELSVRDQLPLPRRTVEGLCPPKSEAGYRRLEVRDELRALLLPMLQGEPAMIRRQTRGEGYRLEASPFFFPYCGDDLGWEPGALHARLYDAAPQFFPRGDFSHVFRHSLGLELAAGGVSEEDTMRILGHDDVETVRCYYGRRVRPGVLRGLDEGGAEK